MEKKDFHKVLQLMRGNEHIQQERILVVLLDFAIGHYINHGNSSLIMRVIQATPVSRRKEASLLAKKHMLSASGSHGSKRPGLSKPVPMLTKFQWDIEKVERDEADAALRLLGVDIQAEREEAEYEALQKVISEQEAKDRAILRKDRSMLSATFSKANGRTFVQGGAPGLVQQRR